MANKTFKIIFHDKDKNITDVKYHLHDTDLATKWFAKIKHLSRIEIDEVESELIDLSNLQKIYSDFCSFSGLEKIDISEIPTQNECNMLHKIYELNHDRLSRQKNNNILYKFHHAIHYAEKADKSLNTKINIGWGVKEGPLTQNMNCQPFYENQLEKNNLYLPWAELGKTPYTYWENNEPSDQRRFDSLCRPHITFRAKFFIALCDLKKPTVFPNQFNQYFNQFKSAWLDKHKIDDWSEKHEWCAPLLAHTDDKIDLFPMQFSKIVL